MALHKLLTFVNRQYTAIVFDGVKIENWFSRIPWIQKRFFSSLDTMTWCLRHRRCTAANQNLAVLLLQQNKPKNCSLPSLIKEENYVTRGNDFRLQKLRVRYDLRKFGFSKLRLRLRLRLLTRSGQIWRQHLHSYIVHVQHLRMSVLLVWDIAVSGTVSGELTVDPLSRKNGFSDLAQSTLQISRKQSAFKPFNN